MHVKIAVMKLNTYCMIRWYCLCFKKCRLCANSDWNHTNIRFNIYKFSQHCFMAVLQIVSYGHHKHALVAQCIIFCFSKLDWKHSVNALAQHKAGFVSCPDWSTAQCTNVIVNVFSWQTTVSWFKRNCYYAHQLTNFTPCHTQSYYLFQHWRRRALYRRLLIWFPGNLVFKFLSLLSFLNEHKCCAYSLPAFSSYKVTQIFFVSFTEGWGNSVTSYLPSVMSTCSYCTPSAPSFTSRVQDLYLKKNNNSPRYLTL